MDFTNKPIQKGDIITADLLNEIVRQVKRALNITGTGGIEVTNTHGGITLRGTSTDVPVELIDIRPPTGVLEPDYRATITENGHPLGYPMTGGGNNAKDAFVYSSGTLMSGEIVSGTLNCSGNIYSGTPAMSVYSRWDNLPPAMPVYAVPISSASGSPAVEVISSCQETLFLTVSGCIPSYNQSGTTATSPGGPLFSGSNSPANLVATYPTLGQAGVRIYPCQKAYGGPPAGRYPSYTSGGAMPDAPQAFNVAHWGPYMEPGSYVAARYIGPDGIQGIPQFSWAVTTPYGAVANMSGGNSQNQYTWEFPLHGTPCSGNTGLACYMAPATSGGLVALPIQIVGNGDLASGNQYWANWSVQYQKYVVVSNPCCASGQYATSGSLSSGGYSSGG
jgi:hypothetical protein